MVFPQGSSKGYYQALTPGTAIISFSHPKGSGGAPVSKDHLITVNQFNITGIEIQHDAQSIPTINIGDTVRFEVFAVTIQLTFFNVC